MEIQGISSRYADSYICLALTDCGAGHETIPCEGRGCQSAQRRRIVRRNERQSDADSYMRASFYCFPQFDLLTFKLANLEM
jgi:hypothetical protein